MTKRKTRPMPGGKRKTVNRLKGKAVDALLLSVELFNRASDRGRYSAVIIHLDHGLEMLLKAALLDGGGDLRGSNEHTTIDFNACIRKCATGLKVPLLRPADAKALLGFHAIRCEEQHFLSDQDEGFLYEMVRIGVKSFADLWERAFGEKIDTLLPDRVIPLATRPGMDIVSLFLSDIVRMRDLIAAGASKKAHAHEIMHKWAVMHSANNDTPLDGPLGSQALSWFESAIISDAGISDIAVGLGGPEVSSGEVRERIALHLTRNDGVPVRIVDEESSDSLIAVREINELDRYPFGTTAIVERMQRSIPEFRQHDVRVAVARLNLKDDPQMFKLIKINKQKIPRYSQQAAKSIAELFEREGHGTLREWFRQVERERKAGLSEHVEK